MMETLFKLLFGHALADWPLQGEHLSKTKNPNYKGGEYVPEGQRPVKIWPLSMGAHGLIHGGMVYLVTGSPILGVLEMGFHCFIDFMKCENVIDPYVDQVLHLLCKVVWAGWMPYF